MSDWSPARIDAIARRDPGALLGVLHAGELSPAQLAHASVALGSVYSVRALTTLRSLALHEDPLVRERAAQGIATAIVHLRTVAMQAVEHLRELAASDPSPGVRAAASAALEDVR